jgi:hypothetical protein
LQIVFKKTSGVKMPTEKKCSLGLIRHYWKQGLNATATTKVICEVEEENVQSDHQETKSRVLPHLLFYRNVFLSWISRFYLLAVDTRFVGCLPLKNLSLIAFINFL